MSDFVSNLGSFKPSSFSGNKPKRRMAGDYLSEFTQKYSDNSQQNEVNNKKDFNTFKGDNNKSYGTNTEKMLFGNSKPATSSSSVPMSATNTKPAVKEKSFDQDNSLVLAYNKLDTYINNYEGPRGFSDDSNLDNNNDTSGRANNVMGYLDFQNKVKYRKQLKREQNISQGLAADFELPEDPQWLQDKKAKQIAAQNAAIAERAANGGKLARPTFREGSNKLTDYPELYKY